MIEKFDDQNGFCMADCMNKINEVINTVNNIQKEREAEWFEIQEWIGILEAVRKSVNIHEKQIDELQMKVEPEKCENPAENVLTKSLRMEKEFAEEECKRLQSELDRTRKALEFSVYVLKDIDELLSSNRFDIKEVPLLSITQTKISMLLRCINLEQITALEQKDKQ